MGKYFSYLLDHIIGIVVVTIIIIVIIVISFVGC